MNNIIMTSALNKYWKISRMFLFFGIHLAVFRCMRLNFSSRCLYDLNKYFYGIHFFYLANLNQINQTHQLNSIEPTLSLTMNPVAYLMQRELIRLRSIEKINVEKTSRDAYLPHNVTQQYFNFTLQVNDQQLLQNQTQKLQNLLQFQQDYYSILNSKIVMHVLPEKNNNLHFYTENKHYLNNAALSSVLNTRHTHNASYRLLHVLSNQSNRVEAFTVTNDAARKTEINLTLSLQSNRFYNDNDFSSNSARPIHYMRFSRHRLQLNHYNISSFTQQREDKKQVIHNNNLSVMQDTMLQVNMEPNLIYRKNSTNMLGENKASVPAATAPVNAMKPILKTERMLVPEVQIIKASSMQNLSLSLAALSPATLESLATTVHKMIGKKLKKDAERRGLR